MSAPKLEFMEARNAMREGAIMIRQHGRKADKFYIEPGGSISRRVFTSLRLCTNVVDNRDGISQHSQSWRWTV